MTHEHPPAADPLYDLPPAEFVAARNALAKELRRAGDKAQAASVARLRRPTPLASALNRLSRHDAAVLDAALEAGAALHRATAAAVAGDASELRPATAADREAVRALTEAVAAILGTGRAELEPRVTATVRAAVASPEVAEELRSGRLTAEHESAGFGLGEPVADDARPPDDLAPRRQAKQAKQAKVDAAARERAEREAQQRRDQRRRETEHRRRVEALESRARRLAEKADEAERVAVAARADALAAEEAIAQARKEAP